jgi:2-polyprenyl-6-methoxyphenol hydroxylase-like FAD-dependent oxidoreductase
MRRISIRQQAAKGLNTGVQDAYNLGWKFAAAMSGARAMCINST